MLTLKSNSEIIYKMKFTTVVRGPIAGSWKLPRNSFYEMLTKLNVLLKSVTYSEEELSRKSKVICFLTK